MTDPTTPPDPTAKSAPTLGSFSDFAAFVDQASEAIDGYQAARNDVAETLFQMSSKLREALICWEVPRPVTISVPIGDSSDPEIEVLTAIAGLMDILDQKIRNPEERAAAARRVSQYVAARWS